MVRTSVCVCVILLLVCGVVPAWSQITCKSGTACKKNHIPVFTSNGGNATVGDSIITSKGGAIGVAGNAAVTGAGAFGTTVNTAAQEEGFASGSSTEVLGDYGVYLSPNATIGEPPDAGVFGETTSGFGTIGASDSGQGGTFVSSDAAAADTPTEFINNISATAGDLVWLAIGGAVGGECFTDTSGDLTCTGTKSAVVAVDKGERNVKLYAVESPKNWFEDVGSEHLSNGSAIVHLEHTFNQTVDTGVEYHVFLTPKGDCKGLYVTNETRSSFEVRELGGGTANIDFDYRIMAARKGYENVRLADVSEKMKHIKNPPSVYGWAGAQK